MSPENGGKIELRLDQSSPGSAEYAAELHTAAGSFETRVLVGAGAGASQVAFGDWRSQVHAPPPEWLVADARAALKSALRTSQSEGRWPRRITRWRPEP